MHKTKDIKQISIAELFERDKYVIPIYQRDYAWLTEDREALIEDFENIDDVDYFLGSLIVKRIKPELKDEHIKYEVVDGQQRLTTLFMILSKIDREKMKRDSLTFEAREKSNEALSQIYDSHELRRPKTLADGYEDINRLVDGNKITIEKLMKAKIIRIEVPKETDLNKYFEIMNTRGEQLEAHEIVKSRFMAKLDILEREFFSKVWDACSEMSRYLQQSLGFKNTKERDIIFSSNWSEFKWASDFDGLFINWSEVAQDNNDSSQSSAVETMTTLLSKPKIEENPYEDTVAGTDYERFNSPLDFSSFLLYVLAIHSGKKNNFDRNNLISAFDNQGYTEKSAKSFMMSLLRVRFYYDKYIIKRDYSEDRDSGNWSLKYAKKYTNPNTKRANLQIDTNTFEMEAERLIQLQSMFRVTYTSAKTMDWIYEVLKFVDAAESEITANHMIDTLEHTARRKILEYLEGDWERLNKDSTGVENIVFNVLDYLLWKQYKQDYGNYRFFYHPSVEHWSPQTPRDNVEEKDYFRNTDNINHFGNLCLVTTAQNSANGNLLPESKLSEYRKENSNQTLKMRLMLDITEEAEGWTVKRMREHGNKMIGILKDFVR